MKRSRQRWREDAVCAQIGGDLWFPEKGDHKAASRARAICETCPVKELCFEEAVNDSSIQHGIWGGKSPRELRAIRLERNLAGADLPEDMEPEEDDSYGA